MRYLILGALLLLPAAHGAAQQAPPSQQPLPSQQPPPSPQAPSVVAPPPLSPPPQIFETPADALVSDAAEYARQFGVSQAEALRRLSTQEASVAATNGIAERYRDRLAGIVIEHRPDYRIVVHLTGAEPVRQSQIKVGMTNIPVTFQTGARGTRDQVVWAMTWHQAEINRALSRPPSMGLDPRTGELVVIIGSAEAGESIDALRSRIETIAGVPVQVRVLNQTQRNLSMLGGARVEGISPNDGKRYLCTTGFNVTDGVRDAVSTAAHCLDELSYRDPQRGLLPLEFVGQWGWGYRDFQINATTETLPPTFYADTAKTRFREVTGQRTRATTRAGDFICHRGESTGYSCAVVELVDFAPAGDLCGGACLPTWVTVAGPTCKNGDSGSPVFSGTTAFGILKGASYRQDGSCAFYFYMSTDYIPPGWSLKLAGALRPDLPVIAGGPAR